MRTVRHNEARHERLQCLHARQAHTATHSSVEFLQRQYHSGWGGVAWQDLQETRVMRVAVVSAQYNTGLHPKTDTSR